MTSRYAVAMVICTAVLPLALVLAGLACGGFPITDVVTEWVKGSLGSGMKCAISLERATPLLLTGLATAVAFRAGVLNIGAEGQYLLGALAVVAVTTRGQSLLGEVGPAATMAIALIIASAAGASWALIASLLERLRAVPLVLSTILLNFVAIALMGALVEGPLHDPATSAPQTALVPDNLHLPVLVEGSKLHLGALIAVALAGMLALVQRSSVLGFEMQVCGLNPRVALQMGMPVAIRHTQVMAISGALAGLAGGMQILGVTYFMTSSTLSYGYAGVAVALLGRLHPIGVVFAAVFFGVLDTGTSALEVHLDIPHDLGDLAKGMIVLAALVSTVLMARMREHSVRVAPSQPPSARGGLHV